VVYVCGVCVVCVWCVYVCVYVCVGSGLCVCVWCVCVVCAVLTTWGRFEAEDLDFHRRVREGYQLLVQREPERVLLVDASGTPEEVFEKLLGILEARAPIFHSTDQGMP